MLAAACTALIVPVTPSRADDSKTFTESANDLYFTPVYRVVTVGDTVVWTNHGQAEHTVTSYPDAPEAFDSSPRTQRVCANQDLVNPTDCLTPGQSFQFTFTAPGVYNYYCKAHGDPSRAPNPKLGASSQPCGMCGQIVVQKKVTTPTQTARPTHRPTQRATATPSASVSPTVTASATPSGPEPTDTADGLAAGGSGGGGGSGGRVAVAFLAIAALSGAGYLTWRRFLVRP